MSREPQVLRIELSLTSGEVLIREWDIENSVVPESLRSPPHWILNPRGSGKNPRVLQGEVKEGYEELAIALLSTPCQYITPEWIKEQEMAGMCITSEMLHQRALNHIATQNGSP